MGSVDAADDESGGPPPGELLIAVSSERGVRVISVRGELERGTMLGFIEACTDHTDESIVIDLGGLTFMDGGGYSSLVVVSEIAEASQRTLDIRNARGQPARLMNLIAELEATQTGSTGPLEDRFDADLDATVDDEVERHYSDLLAQFAQTMWTDVPTQAFLDQLVERIVQVLPIEGAAVAIISPAGEPDHVTASDRTTLQYERLQSKVGEGPSVAARLDGTAVSVVDVHHDDRFPRFARRAGAEGLGAAFAFPLDFDDRCLGALNLYRGRPGALSTRQLDLAQTLANVAAAYLVNAEARAELVASTQRANHAALHDPLTGLPNRALLFERLLDAMNRGRRTGCLVGILYIDLDTFKAINDTFGHGVGDEVLLIVAQRLTALLRPGDTVCRLGGDEFVVLCGDLPDAAYLWPIAERVKDAFGATFDVSIGPLRVRASIGVDIGDWTSTTPERLLDRADTAMYHAKRAGGGRHAFLEGRGETATPAGQ